MRFWHLISVALILMLTVSIAGAAGPWNTDQGGTGRNQVLIGELLVGSGSKHLDVITPTTSGYVLTAQGAGAKPVWAASTGSTVDLASAEVTGILPGANGGTGVANTSKTITLGGNLTTSGAHATTLTTTGTTGVTLPTTGTLATLAGTEILSGKTLTNPSHTAGTTTVPAMTLLAGTNMTTPSAGSVEFDGNIFMASPAASARGFIPTTMYSFVPAAHFSLQTAAGVQSAFPTSGDVFTLRATTKYQFEGFYYISKVNNSITTAMAFACSSAPTGILYEAITQNAAKNTTGTAQSSVYVDTVATTVVNAATTGNNFIKFKGTLITNGATTVTPQVDFSDTADTPVMLQGSYIMFTPVGADTQDILGNVG